MKLKSQVNASLCSLQNTLKVQRFSLNRRLNFGTGAAAKHSFLSNNRLIRSIFIYKLQTQASTLYRHHSNFRTTAKFFNSFKAYVTSRYCAHET